MIQEQTEEIVRLQLLLSDLQTKYTTDVSQLQTELKDSTVREQYLQYLNNEAYDLMTIHGIKKLS